MENFSQSNCSEYYYTIPHEGYEVQQTLEAKLRFYLEGIFLPFIGTVGFFGNGISLYILIFINLEYKPVYRQLISSLVIWDTFFILISISLFSLTHILPESFQESVLPWIVPYLYPLVQIVQHGSVCTTLAVATERFLSVCKPDRYIPAFSGFLTNAAILCFTLLFNLPRFFELNTELVEDIGCDIHFYTVKPTSLRLSHLYSFTIMFTTILLLNLLPCFLLTTLNKKIYGVVQQKIKVMRTLNRRKRRDLTVSQVLIFVVLIFLLCHSLKLGLNLYELSLALQGKEIKEELDRSDCFRILSIFSNILIVFNSSINFFIYVFKDPKFYKTVLNHIKCREDIPHRVHELSQMEERESDENKQSRKILQKTRV